MNASSHRSRRRFLARLAVVTATAIIASACETTASPPADRPAFGSPGGDDKPLSAAVREALRNHAQTAPHPIKVSSEDDVVTLRGYVFSDAERDAAERIAQRVEGVRSVINTLSIR